MAFTRFFGLLLYILLFYRVVFASASINGDKVADFELISKDRIDAGKSKLEEFTAHAKSSDCWRKAVQGIEKRCKSLGDIEQSYLAIDFTNCHMSKSGRKIYSCSRETQSIDQCTGSMDDTTYLTYTTFFTHAANICFYVKSEIWQQRTEETISKLSRTSQDVAEQLEESAERQFLVLERQNVSLKNQKEIISNEIHLSETLRNSTLNAKKAFEDMKQNAHEQKALFSETFDGFFKSVEKVRELQSLILGEFISLQSVAFYIAAVCTCYFFTSSPRTAAARLPLFIGLFVVMFIERLVTSWGVTDTQSTDTAELLPAIEGKEYMLLDLILPWPVGFASGKDLLPLMSLALVTSSLEDSPLILLEGDKSKGRLVEAIHTRLWFCRKLYIIVATLVLMVVGYQYQDYNKINFDMLRSMQLQITEIKQWQEKINSLKAITNGESPAHQSLLPGASLSQQSITHPRYSNHGKPCDIPDASMDNNERNLGDDIDNDDDDDDSDHSFVPNESELESFSEESSEEEEEDEEHDMVGGKKIEPDITTPVTRKTSIGLPKETSTKTNSTSSRKTRSRERTPDSSPSYRYNLRSRRNTPSDIHNGSFLSNMPSPSKLKELFKAVQQRSSRRYTAVIRTPRNNDTSNTALFSSDEEC